MGHYLKRVNANRINEFKKRLLTALFTGIEKPITLLAKPLAYLTQSPLAHIE